MGRRESRSLVNALHPGREVRHPRWRCEGLILGVDSVSLFPWRPFRCLTERLRSSWRTRAARPAYRPGLYTFLSRPIREKLQERTGMLSIFKSNARNARKMIWMDIAIFFRRRPEVCSRSITGRQLLRELQDLFDKEGPGQRHLPA